MTAIILTFVPAIGSYAVPDIVGGTDGMMLGNVIANKMFVLRDWPSASAICTVFIVIILIIVVSQVKEVEKMYDDKRRISLFFFHNCNDFLLCTNYNVSLIII